MTDPADNTAAAGGTTATDPAATNTPGTTTATTGAATTEAAAGASTTSGTAAAAPQASAATPLDTLLGGLETMAEDVIGQNLSPLNLLLGLTLADASKATLSFYLTTPTPASTSGTAPKGGCLNDVLGSVRTAVNDSATFSETMTVEQGYVCITGLSRS